MIRAVLRWAMKEPIEVFLLRFGILQNPNYYLKDEMSELSSEEEAPTKVKHAKSAAKKNK